MAGGDDIPEILSRESVAANQLPVLAGQPLPLPKTHLAILGGLRHASPDSVNTGWRNTSFRGYADYMQTPKFEEGLETLIQLARKDRIALMCAEAVPWRCHRSLIEDALSVRGIRCEDIMNSGPRRAHTLTPFAHVSGTMITYPPEQVEMPI